jgi:F-box protein 9
LESNEMTSTTTDAEAELERFREQWRAEVARNRRPDGPAESDSKLQKRQDQGLRQSTAGPSTARRKDLIDYSEEVEPRAYHDLPDKEELLKLGVEGQNSDRNPYKEPVSALEHYERAVEKETQGQLGESVTHYRRAFKVRAPFSLLNSRIVLR